MVLVAGSSPAGAFVPFKYISPCQKCNLTLEFSIFTEMKNEVMWIVLTRYDMMSETSVQICLFRTIFINMRGYEDSQRPHTETWGLWLAASPSLSSLSTQWRRQPDAGAALERSRYRRTLPQCAALSLSIKSPLGVGSVC